MRTWFFTAVIVATVSRAAVGASLTVGDLRIVEGNSGDRRAEVTVALSQPAPGPVTVTYSTRDGTALAGSDYRAATGTVTFARGEAAKKIAIAVLGDTATEPDETFQVVLSNASGATIAQGNGTVTIVNDDAVGGPPTYEVRFTYTGYTGAMAGVPDCPVRVLRTAPASWRLARCSRRARRRWKLNVSRRSGAGRRRKTNSR